MRLSDLTKKDDPGAIAPEEESNGITSLTPAGIEIFFQSRPKRLYRIRQMEVDGPNVTEWREVPSTSEITDILGKGGLSIWGQRIGSAGVLELIERGELLWVED